MYAAVSLFCRTALCFVKVSPNVTLGAHQRGADPRVQTLVAETDCGQLKTFFFKKTNVLCNAQPFGPAWYLSVHSKVTVAKINSFCSNTKWLNVTLLSVSLYGPLRRF